MIQKKLSFKVSNLIPLILVVILAAIYFFPIVLMLATAVKTNDQAFNTALGLWPKTFHLENFRTVFEIMPFGRYAFNSLYVSVLSVLGIIISCPMVAYSLSKIRWAGKEMVFSLTTACMMIPYTVTMVPLYRMWSRAGLVGTFWPLILPAFFGAPFYIIILRQFMLTIPDELLEAAEIDGASQMRTLKVCMTATGALAFPWVSLDPAASRTSPGSACMSSFLRTSIGHFL